jgi:hypothetical protein
MSKVKFKRRKNKDELILLNPEINFSLGDVDVKYKAPINIRQKERIETIVTMFNLNGTTSIKPNDEDFLFELLENNFDIMVENENPDIHLITLVSIFAVFLSKLSQVEAENKKK